MILHGALRNFKMLPQQIDAWLSKSKGKKFFFFLASFLLPAAIFFLYFAFNHGNLLIVDLGQQYIDLLAYLRQNLFCHPTRLLYSFSNGLGNSMLGTDAYYLNSPFNLLLFLFPQKLLPWAILTVISTKVGAIGLSSAYYWRHKTKQPFYALAAANAYALCGYVIAYYFNLMWLDSLICLPLLLRAIDQILAKKKSRLWLLTFACWATNFYTGAMDLIFAFFYFCGHLMLTFFSSNKNLIKRYLQQSIVGSLLASFVLLPALVDLLAGKTSDAPSWSFSWQFNLAQELNKLALGSYNFSEMQTGMPNIYLTMPFLFLLFLYFCCPNIKRQAKIMNAAILILLILSLSFSPLVLFWHLGQFPIWYPGRFTFILIFFALDLGIDFLAQGVTVKTSSKIILFLLAAGLSLFWLFKQKSVSFFNQSNLIISCLFLLLAYLFFAFIYRQVKNDSLYLWFLVVIELTANLLLCFRNLSFQENNDYVNFAQNTRQAVTYLNKQKPGFYRIEKSFERSDDDPLTANYAGLSSFNSLSNRKTQTFLAKMGYLHNNNSVTNNGGSPLSDAFLGIRYYIEPQRQPVGISPGQTMNFANDNHRLDQGQKLIASFKQLQISQSPALPFLFLTKSRPKPQLSAGQPLINQEKILQQVLRPRQSFIKKTSWPQVELCGCRRNPAIQQQYLRRQQAKQSKITFILPVKKNGSYYLQLPAGLNQSQADLWLNNSPIDLSVRDAQTHLLNLASRDKGRTIKLTFILRQRSLSLHGLRFWYLNTPYLHELVHRFAQKQPTSSYTHLQVKMSSFTSRRQQTLLTTIPASKSWLIFDHSHLLKAKTFCATFLAAELSPGKHQLRLIYFPFALVAGILLSLTALFWLVKSHFD